MSKTATKFNTRAFVGLMIALTGLGLPATGIANHLFGFSPMSLERHAWMSAHNVLALLFTAFCVWHVVLNRRVLWNHLRNAASRIPPISREALLASTIVAAMLALFVGHAFHAPH